MSVTADTGSTRLHDCVCKEAFYSKNVSESASMEFSCVTKFNSIRFSRFCDTDAKGAIFQRQQNKLEISADAQYACVVRYDDDGGEYEAFMGIYWHRVDGQESQITLNYTVYKNGQIHSQQLVATLSMSNIGENNLETAISTGPWKTFCNQSDANDPGIIDTATYTIHIDGPPVREELDCPSSYLASDLTRDFLEMDIDKCNK